MTKNEGVNNDEQGIESKFNDDDNQNDNNKADFVIDEYDITLEKQLRTTIKSSNLTSDIMIQEVDDMQQSKQPLHDKLQPKEEHSHNNSTDIPRIASKNDFSVTYDPSTGSVEASTTNSYENGQHLNDIDIERDIETTTTRVKNSKKKQRKSTQVDQTAEHYERQQVYMERLQRLEEENRKQKSQQQQSISDWIASSAFDASVQVLKFAGNVTVQAGSAFVAPPLQLTKDILLPQFYTIFKEHLSTNTPRRIQDWFYVIQSCFYHFFHTLIQTDSGKAFIQRLIIVGIDILELISAVTFRQYCIDIMSLFVKTMEWLSTPEFHVVLDQCSITMIRTIDILYQSKLLFMDTIQTIKSMTSMLSNEVTINALAEITAHLCYTLEMEQMELKKNRNSQTNHNSKLKRQRYRRQQERDQYQQQIYLDQLNLLNETNTTIEDAILNSLGKKANRRRYKNDAGKVSKKRDETKLINSRSSNNAYSSQEDDKSDATGSRKKKNGQKSIPSRIIVQQQQNRMIKNDSSSSLSSWKQHNRKQQFDIVQEVDDEEGMEDDDDDDERKQQVVPINEHQKNNKEPPTNFSDSVRENVNVDYLSLFIHQRETNSNNVVEVGASMDTKDRFDQNPLRQIVSRNDEYNEHNDTNVTIDAEDIVVNNNDVKNVKKKKTNKSSSSTFLMIRDVEYDGEDDEQKPSNTNKKKLETNKIMRYKEKFHKMKKMNLSWSSASSPSSSSSSDYEDIAYDNQGIVLDENDIDDVKLNQNINNNYQTNNHNLNLFNERLDQLLTEKRSNGLEHALNDEPNKFFFNKSAEHNKDDAIHIPIVKKFMSAFTSSNNTAATGGNDKDDPDDNDGLNLGGKTIEERLHEIRSELRKSLQTSTKNTKQSIWNTNLTAGESSAIAAASKNTINNYQRKKKLLFIIVGCIILFSTVTMWFTFGLYGMYIMFVVNNRIVESKPNHNNDATEEMIIRLLQEIVHIDKRMNNYNIDTNPKHMTCENVVDGRDDKNLLPKM